MTVSLQGKMPDGDGNGLTPIVSDLIAQATGQQEKRRYVAVCLLDVVKVTTNADTAATTPTVRIRRIEVADGADRELAENLMQRALDARTGREALPYDLEQELRGVFDNADSTVNPDTLG